MIPHKPATTPFHTTSKSEISKKPPENNRKRSKSDKITKENKKKITKNDQK